jgi:putative transposase
MSSSLTRASLLRSKEGGGHPYWLLEYLIILGERALASILRRYCRYFNSARPHQGIGQRVPDGPTTAADAGRPIVEIPVLGGLHHEYRRAA